MRHGRAVQVDVGVHDDAVAWPGGEAHLQIAASERRLLEAAFLEPVQ